MSKQVLFIQGGGADVHDQWDDKLVDSLKRELGPGFEVRYPRMPNEADPDYATWKAAIAKEIFGLHDGAVLVAHSIGGTILLNAMAEAPPTRRLAGVILISAPFVGAGGWPSDEIGPMGNIGARLPAGTPIQLFYGDKDDTTPPVHADLYEAAVPGAAVRRLPGRDHQLNNDLAEVAESVRALV